MNHDVAWILMIEACCIKLLKTHQLYQRLGVFHGQRQETSEIEVSVVLRLQQNNTFNMLFVLRETYGFSEIFRTRPGGVRTRCNE